MAKLVDKTYGQALFDLGVEESRIDAFADEVEVIKAVFVENPDLMVLLTHPQITKESKIEVIRNGFGGKISDELVGFLVIIIKASRQSDLMGILEYFLDVVKAYKHIGVAYVTSSVELTDAMKQAVEKRLLAITDNVKYEMHFSVDESLIGGMVIRIGDKVVDSSIQTKLSTLTRSLLKIQLN